MPALTALKAAGSLAKTGMEIGKTIASAVDAGDKQAEARQLAEMERKREDELRDRKFRQEDAAAARTGEEIMLRRGERAEAKQEAEQARGYQQGQNALNRTLTQLNSNPALRERTLRLFKR